MSRSWMRGWFCLGLTVVAATALATPLHAGNGAPSGPHYNLNIVGVPKGKTADMTGTSGHSIFVNLSGNTKIFLQPGDDYLVTGQNPQSSVATAREVLSALRVPA